MFGDLPQASEMVSILPQLLVAALAMVVLLVDACAPKGSAGRAPDSDASERDQVTHRNLSPSWDACIERRARGAFRISWLKISMAHLMLGRSRCMDPSPLLPLPRSSSPAGSPMRRRRRNRRSSATATFVKGPRATKVTSPGRTRASRTI